MLERAFKERSGMLVWLKTDFKVLASDSRFEDLTRRIGFPPPNRSGAPEPKS